MIIKFKPTPKYIKIYIISFVILQTGYLQAFSGRLYILKSNFIFCTGEE